MDSLDAIERQRIVEHVAFRITSAKESRAATQSPMAYIGYDILIVHLEALLEDIRAGWTIEEKKAAKEA